MAPIRIGFVGLSTSGWAAYSHTPFLRHSSQFIVYGICNTTKASAEDAIKHYSLPPTTKAYSSIHELVADPEVDLVVVSVRVDRHLEPVRLALENGKNCYTEWPLGRSFVEAKTMNQLAESAGVRTMVGLQGPRDPVINKVKELVMSGRIGRILNSSLAATAMDLPWKGSSERDWYHSDKSVGGNLLTIHFAHVLHYVLYCIGDLAEYTSMVSTQRPETKIVDQSGNLLRKIPRDAPDVLTLQGKLKSGGVLTMNLREGTPFKGNPGMVWRIYGERGEIELLADATFAQLGTPVHSLKLHDFESDAVEEVSYDDLMHHKELPAISRNVAALYDNFADGKMEEYVQWDEAVRLHELLEGLQKSSETGQRIYVA